MQPRPIRASLRFISAHLTDGTPLHQLLIGYRGPTRNYSLVQELQPDGDMASIALALEARSSRPRVFNPVRSYQAFYGGVERDTDLLSSQVSTEGRNTQKGVKLLISYPGER